MTASELLRVRAYLAVEMERLGDLIVRAWTWGPVKLSTELFAEESALLTSYITDEDYGREPVRLWLR
jgi:hypothetical protein